MKFYELKILFNDALDDVKKQKSPSLRYIILAYNNVFKKISDAYSDNEMVTDSKIDKLELTKNMNEKLKELSDIKLSKKQQEQMKEEQKINKLKYQLDSLLGIGDKKAEELINMGLKNINQLYNKKWYDKLNTDTQVILTYKPSRYVAYEDIQKIEKKITNFGKGTIIVGSYRRKKPYVRDIDVLYLPTAENTIESYIDYLKHAFHNIWIYANGNDKISMIIQPYKTADIKYKMDIFITTKETYYSNLLYATGSKLNNIKMRAKAKRLGLLLNQNGIFKNGRKINKPMDDEKKLFEILGMQYLVPEDRR